MRRAVVFGLLMAFGVGIAGREARAQAPFSGTNDPFFAYYALYLTRQQAQALSPGPEATINANAANRQRYAATNRSDMFDPNGNIASPFDTSDGFGFNGGQSRRAPRTGPRISQHGGNLAGLGPAGYFDQAGVFYPGLRKGQGKNANVSVVRPRSFAGGGYGVGLPGPR